MEGCRKREGDKRMKRPRTRNQLARGLRPQSGTKSLSYRSFYEHKKTKQKKTKKNKETIDNRGKSRGTGFVIYQLLVEVTVTSNSKR